MRTITIEEAEGLTTHALVRRPEIEARVRDIIADVGARGGEAVTELRAEHDAAGRRGDPLELGAPAFEAALLGLKVPLRQALEGMATRVRTFAQAQRAAVLGVSMETIPGARCEQRVQPIARVGCYVPGGAHPLPSTLIMTAVTARAAGVRDVVCVCPDPQPIVLAAAALAGVDRLFTVGGAHGVAALAYGVPELSIPRVDLICGPGGAYVAEAKRQLFGVCGIDLPAGPSEVLVIADEHAAPEAVIADLEAQAEHDALARPLLATTSETLAERVSEHVSEGFAGRPNHAAMAGAFADGGLIVRCVSREELVRAANALAPEHLALHVENPETLLSSIDHFGAAFLGGHAAEVFGDYGVGPNHVLPTAGAARFTAGLSVHTFLRFQTVITLTPGAAAALAEPTALLADAEGLAAHARAARLRGGTDPKPASRPAS